MSDYRNLDSVLQQLQSLGLAPELPLQIGKLTRCLMEGQHGAHRNGSGWYVLHPLKLDNGSMVLVGSYGTYRETGTDGTKGTGHKISLKGMELTREQQTAIRQRVAEDSRRAELERRRRADRAALRAASAWAKCSANGQSEYLQRKGVKGHGVRYSPSGNLVIPILDGAERICGLQVIYDDPAIKKRKGRDRDYWPAGLSKRGRYYLIGRPSWIVLVAEGYATAASLHEATGLPVAVAFDAGNLLAVCQQLRHQYQDVWILVCGDDDYMQTCRACHKRTRVAKPECDQCGEPHLQGNTGESSASAAALAVDGTYVLPQFDGRDRQKWTDFNDLHLASGLHAVRGQIEAKLAREGWDEKGWHRRAGQRAGAAGAQNEEWPWSLSELLNHFAIIYSTDTAFDGRRKLVTALGPLRSSAGKGVVRSWLEHPARRIVMPDQVVFDPAAPNDGTTCNLWAGWPTEPKAGDCDKLLELFEHLCSGEENASEVFDWIMCWLAYPIQNPGAKMQTALLIHGPEGSGKNLAFGAIRKIYGKYGGIFSQTELESQFNGWSSCKLFMIGNEVVSRVELYHQQGRLKNMITESEWQVNEKNLPTRLEANHCNFVFFSNRLDIAKLDRDDRRYCVVWTPRPKPDAFYESVRAEIDNGGIEALHDHLLRLNLDDFKPWSKPPMTRSKMELTDLSADSPDRFWREWQEQAIPLPLVPVRTEILFGAYRHWAGLQNIPRAVPMHIFAGMIGKKLPGTTRRVRYIHGHSTRQGTFVFLPIESCNQPADKRPVDWLTQCDQNFKGALKDWREET